MRITQVAVAGFVLLAPPTIRAQLPHLAGTVALVPARGEIDGALCLSRFAPRQTARFVLANPLNIQIVTDTTGRAIPYDGEYGGRILGESREYVIRQPDSLPPLAAFCVRFRGAVPPFDSATAYTDWKGRITSMQGTLRAAEQTRWYPTLFDSVTTAREDAVTYDLRVRCATCRGIYVNGSEPVADTAAHFTSTVPRTLMLYAGDFAVQRSPAATFVDGRADSTTARIFSDAIARVGSYYARLVGVPYGERPVLLSFESVSRGYPHGQVRWQFVTWPTITFSGGLDFDSLLDRRASVPRFPDWLWSGMSHEMGHYYFGTLRMPHGPLYWFVLESTAEYLAIKSTAALRGEEVAASRMIGHLNALGTDRYEALQAIREREQITALYRYQLAPLRLLALDWRVGEAKVGALLNALLRSPAAMAADYAALRAAAADAGIPVEQLDAAMAASLPELRVAVLERARATLAKQARVESSAPVVQLASDLVNADTTSAGRRQIMTALRAIVARDPSNLPALYQVGKLGAVGNFELGAAQAALERYLRSTPPAGAPVHADASFRLGMVLEHRGNRAAALAAYRRALELTPAHPGATEALARLENK